MILVGGDFVIDHHIYEGDRHHFGDPEDRGVTVCRELGGTALIHKILTALAPDRKGSALTIEEPHKDALEVLSLHSGHDAHALWRPYAEDKSSKSICWRVREGMGFGRGMDKAGKSPWKRKEKFPDKPDVLALSEGGMGFRDDRAAWEKLPWEEVGHIVLKMSAPLAEGALWDHLINTPGLRDKLVMVLAASDLRKMPVHISEGRSWEETLESLSCELSRKDSVLAPLCHCRHLVVTFGVEAAVWYDFSDPSHIEQARVHFVYDPAHAENEHARNTPGKVFGLLSCLAASVAWRLAQKDAPLDLIPAIEGGLAAMRDLLQKGHGNVSAPNKGYPAKRLAGIIQHSNEPQFTRLNLGNFLACDFCRDPMCKKEKQTETPQRWSLLRLAQWGENSDSVPEPCVELARLVLEYGYVALRRMPHLNIGHLFTADRAEIEMLRSLRTIIQRYVVKGADNKPLSIGVCGPPGAGKSFSVKQIAAKLVGANSWLEFNLSQFNDARDLIGAFHQIRDMRLQGKTPVAFLDEFDAGQYKWLQYLLAPMQDGRFQEGQITHALGKCIFILAGATSRSFESFGPPEDSQSQAYQAFVLAKGPDFKSRLDAYLDVSGPNRRDWLVDPKSKPLPESVLINGWYFTPDEDDLCYPIRRAFNIRSGLGCFQDERIEMDEGLAQALLRVRAYKHGARSLSKILEPFKGIKNQPLGCSMLPARPILAMHTDADEFLGLCMRTWLKPRAVSPSESTGYAERIAPIIHATYRALGKRENWLKKKMDKEYKQLDRFTKKSNIAAAQRMPGILALVGLALKEGAPESPEMEQRVHQHLELHLDLLAMKEHAGWMQWHMEQGWQYAPQRDDNKKKHNCLLPFSQLSEKEKNKDREQIRHYPDFARKAGLSIVPAS